jgi:hypothetical protein
VDDVYGGGEAACGGCEELEVGVALGVKLRDGSRDAGFELWGEGDGVAFGVDLEGFDVEVGEVGATKAGGDGDVGGVAAGGHEDAADAGIVVAGVHVPPAVS